MFESEDYESYDKLGFKEKGENNSVSGEAASSAFDFLELKGAKGNTRSEESVEERDLLEVGEQINGRVAPRKGRQMVRRSNMVAKQVISIRSALSLGFVSELWVDITSVSDDRVHNSNLRLKLYICASTLLIVAEIFLFSVGGFICTSEAKFAFWGIRNFSI